MFQSWGAEVVSNGRKGGRRQKVCFVLFQMILFIALISLTKQIHINGSTHNSHVVVHLEHLYLFLQIFLETLNVLQLSRQLSLFSIHTSQFINTVQGLFDLTLKITLVTQQVCMIEAVKRTSRSIQRFGKFICCIC